MMFLRCSRDIEIYTLIRYSQNVPKMSLGHFGTKMEYPWDIRRMFFRCFGDLEISTLIRYPLNIYGMTLGHSRTIRGHL